ncbi:MAG: SDR family oxidoreductase [Pseudomonadota bacterium]
MDLGLNGKVAIVTGAGSGIGRQIALDMAGEGATVIVADLNLANAEATVAEAGSGTAVQLDVTSFEAATGVVNDVVAAHGGLNVLVNCAGAWRPALFTESKPEDWAFEINVCLMGVINCTRAALDPMIAGGGGKIVNISSDAGRIGEFRQSVYSGAKAGVIGFSKAVAREVGKSGVHINCVCPGYTKTPGTSDLNEEMEARIAKGYPLRKIGLPGDVSRLAVFLASDGASHTTGQTISVSGGYSMV